MKWSSLTVDTFLADCAANASLTFTAGTAVGWFRTTSGWYHAGHGIHVGDQQSVSFQGTATAPCYWVRLNTVQEQDKTAGYGPGGISSWVNSTDVSHWPTMRLNWTKCSLMAGEGGGFFRDDWGYLIVRAAACEFSAGNAGGYGTSMDFTNCLLDRTYFANVSGAAGNEVVARNCTVHGGFIQMNTSTAFPISIQNCALDGTRLDLSGYAANSSYADYSYNAFTNSTNPFPFGGNNVVVTSFNWQTNQLGNFYLPSDSPLIDAGSMTAEQAGLYEYTTQTNQAEEFNSQVDIGYHYVALDANGNPVTTLTNGIPDYIYDASGNGLPDAWEWHWFGNYSHTADELDAIGAHTLLYCYQNELTPLDSAYGFYDYMHVKACAPCPALSWGFDVANYVPGDAPELQHPILGGGDSYRWPMPSEFQNPYREPMTFYRRKVVIENYVGWIGSTDGNGVFHGQFVTKTLTTVSQGYPYYQNLWNLDQVEVDGQSDSVPPGGRGAVNLDTSTDPSRSQDLRVSGFPSDYELTTKVTFHASDNSSFDDFLIAPTGHNSIDGNPEYYWTQEFSPPPDVTPTEVTEYFDTDNPQMPEGDPDAVFNTVQLGTRITRLEDAVTWDEYMNQIDALLNTVPLTQRTAVTTREGPLYFDFFGLSDAYPDMNLLANAYYDFNTMEYSFSVTPDVAYGIQFGPNETGMPGSLVSTTTFITGDTRGAGRDFQLYPYFWDPNATYVEQVLCNGFTAPEWWTGNAANNGSDLPSTCCFVSHTGNVTLHGGKSSYPRWEADMSYAVGTKITDANGHSEVCTVAGRSNPNSEPAWATTLGGTTTDNTVHWQAIQTPVTAIVSGAHANRLVVFPLKSGNVIACDTTPCHAGVNSPTEGELSSYYGDLFNGFMKEKSRVRIPYIPESIRTDVANFNDIAGSVPTKNILLNAYYQYDLSDNRLEPLSDLTGGEYLFGPGDVQSPTGYGFLQFDPCEALAPQIDVDVDSDNNNGLNPPDRNNNEDQIEDDATLPGKILVAKTGDADDDGIPDYADGFNYDGITENADDNAGANNQLVPVILEVPAGMDLNYTKLSIYYNASDPAGIYHDTSANTWTPAGGNLRIWLKDGDQSRNMARANAVVSPGDYVAPGDYTLAQLGFTPTKNTVTVFVEGIAPSGSTGDLTISASLYPAWNGPVSSDEVRVTVINPQLEVDNSRDGQITGDTVDKTSSSNPYRFWLNSNHDGTEMMDGKYPVQEDLNPSSGSDVNNTAISCTRDLEDYSRIWITKDQMINQWLQSGKFLLALEWKSIAAGSPKIRIFPAYEPDGGRQYLTDSNTANSQISTPYGTAVTDKNGLQAVTSAKFFFPTTFWSNQSYDPTTYFLFDAISEGDGQLVVSLYQPDATTKVVESAPLYLRLRDIKKMYERWTVDPAASEDSNGGVTPNAVARIAAARSPGGFQYDANSPEEQKYILFVHGWNMDPWEKDAFAETAYKRLWWQGYKGRFGAFQWPTTYGFTGGIQAATDGRNFDNGEFVAWQSATGLLNKLNDLNSLYPGQVYLLAHSMGNVVAGEALRMAGVDTPVNTYVAAQAAIPAHAYDANCSPSPHSFYWTDPLGVTHNMDSGTTNRYAEYPTDGAPPYFNGIQGAQTFVNFYNENDYALSMWIVDQDFKPDNGIAFPGYYYDPPSTTHPTGFYYIAGSQDYDLFFPADTYKIFAYADEARSFALGATAGVNIFNGQPLGSTVWPDDTFDQGAYKEHPWHSAEFLFSNIEQNKFWNILMIKFGITPNP